jgi:hypothetical protein
VRSLSWAATELGIAVSTARALAERGRLPGAFKLGDKLWRVSVPKFRADVLTLADEERARWNHPAGKSLVAQDQERAERRSPIPLSIVADAPDLGGNAFLGDSVSKDTESIGAVHAVDGERKRAPHRANARKRAQTALSERKQSTESPTGTVDNP